MQMGEVTMNGVTGGGGVTEEREADTRGLKRQASDSDLNDFSRFEKRLRALSIRNDEKRAEKNSVPSFHRRKPSKNGVLSTGFKRTPPLPVVNNDGMDIEDTPNRVYIADLDAELASSSDEEEKLVFLPDIEKKLNRLPPQVYNPLPAEGQGRQELVLYSDPRSLSAPDAEQDPTRRAVLEARERAREKALERQVDMERMYSSAVMEGGVVNGEEGMAVGVERAHGYGDAGYVSPLRLDGEAEGQGEWEFDPDAMELG